MTADLLNRAATLIRERAEAASQGRWCVHGSSQTYGPTGDAHGVDVLRHEFGFDDRIAHIEPWGGVNDATHIASWHPAVALAVAEWLEDAAGAWNQQAATFAPGGPLAAIGTWTPPDHHPAIKVARAYLGEDA